MEARLPLQIVSGRGLVSTHWTTIQACTGTGTTAQLARERLCRDYWYPLYAHVKRLGHQGCDAEDVTQEFFAYILSTSWLERADQTKGRFRSFLLNSLENFLRDRIGASKARKRAGGYQHVPMDMGEIDTQAAAVAPNGYRSFEVYEAEWANAIVSMAWRRLAEEYAEAGKRSQFDQLKTFLTTAGDHAQYQAAAAVLATSLENIKVAVHRMRKRYGAILREEVSRTVASVDDIPQEMLFIREAFAKAATAAA